MAIFALRSSIFTGSFTLSRTSISRVYFRLDILCVPEGGYFLQHSVVHWMYYWHVGIRIFQNIVSRPFKGICVPHEIMFGPGNLEIVVTLFFINILHIWKIFMNEFI